MLIERASGVKIKVCCYDIKQFVRLFARPQRDGERLLIVRVGQCIICGVETILVVLGHCHWCSAGLVPSIFFLLHS